jgi:methionyl-tRNA formyltransferase
VDILLNVHSLYIVHRDVLAAPRLGAFNLHPGPLPRYAGLNAVSWAIYRGEETHGVTIHKMEPEIDTGPIVSQSFFPVEDSATGLSLSFKCVREGLRLMLNLLDNASIEPSLIPLLSQDLRQREYFGVEIPNDGWLAWSSPAKRVLNFVRACDYLPFRSPWGCPKTQLGAREVGVVKAKATGLPCDALPGTVGYHFDSGVQVACLDEWVLVKQLKIDDEYVNPADVLKRGDHLGIGTYHQSSFESASQFSR